MEYILALADTASLSSHIVILGNEEAAEKVLRMMRARNPTVLVLCNEEHPTEALNDAVCQHIAEKGLKEIMDTIKSKPIVDDHLFSGAILVSIKDIHLVKKYIWKDNNFIPAMARLLKHRITEDNSTMFRDIVVCILQGIILGGTPKVFYESIAKSDIIDTYRDIFKDRIELFFKPSYEKMVLTLLVLCQNNELCLAKCRDLEISTSLDQFSYWEELDEEIKEKVQVACQCISHMSHQDDLPEHRKVILNKFSDHMHEKNKNYKRMETVKCSYSPCHKIQPDTKEGRFKKCARCRVVLYCSKDCQKAHWVHGHSAVCVSPSGEKS